MKPKMHEELARREMENKARKFLDEYRKLSVKYGVEFSVEKPKFVIIESAYVQPNGEKK